MPANQVKNQHYVPRGHLHLFADQNKSFWVYDKVKGTIFGASVRDVASESYFNELYPDKNKAFQAGEKYFLSVEELGLPILASLEDRIINNQDIDTMQVLNNQEKTMLSYYLAVQMQRTKEAREETREIMNKLGTHLARKLAPPRPPSLANFSINDLINLKFSDDYVRFVHIQTVAGQADTISKILYNMVWVFGINESEREFLISDNPVVREANLQFSNNSGRGLMSPGVQVHVPISPRIRLIICDPRYARASLLNGKAERITEEAVMKSNTAQVKHAHRFIFGSKKNLEGAHELCEQNPNWRLQERERFKDEWLDKEKFVRTIMQQNVPDQDTEG